MTIAHHSHGTIHPSVFERRRGIGVGVSLLTLVVMGVLLGGAVGMALVGLVRMLTSLA